MHLFRLLQPFLHLHLNKEDFDELKLEMLVFVLNSNATSHATLVSLPSGANDVHIGIALKPANCSIGSCVGPSSPTAIESCVE